jgi:Zn-dependent protease with chaperone function
MPKNKIKLSPEFKMQAVKAVAGIVAFAVIYLTMLALAAGLTALCLYGSIMLVSAKISVITIGLGIGLASFGVLILVFLVKFAFQSNNADRSHLFEITRDEEPKLFAMIEEIVNEVGTHFPKKVFLSADVNASVFYDSSFWSMFLPVRKNLQIGMGLVNSVTEDELRAILAHEFGHFSQRTMKIGSYVYNVNRIIFNLLEENGSFDRVVRSWAEISGYFAIFVAIGANVIGGVQWTLKKLYGAVNKSHMGLSREMEFQADEIAAGVTGPGPLKSSLLRMDLADHAFNNVAGFYNGRIADGLKSENFYRDHLLVMQTLAGYNGIPVIAELPDVTPDDLNRFNKSKLVIKDQWASHPDTQERIDRLIRNTAAGTQRKSGPAGNIFADIEKTQQKLTEAMFRDVAYNVEVRILTPEEFGISYGEDFRNNTFSRIFNSYYDNKNPVFFDTKTVPDPESYITADDLFSDRKVDLVYTSVALQNDIAVLKQIAERKVAIRTFDYDGIKYGRSKAQKLVAQLESELGHVNGLIKENDLRIFAFFLGRERNEGASHLASLYDEFFGLERTSEINYKVCNELYERLQFTSQVTPFEEIAANFRAIKPLENTLKGQISKLMEDPLYTGELTQETRESFGKYLSKEATYFDNGQYVDANLQLLFQVINGYAYLISRGHFLVKKKLLNYQADLRESEVEVLR